MTETSTVSLVEELRKQFYRTGPLPEVHIPGVRPSSKSDLAEQQHRLSTFADAVRNKERWYFKILKQSELAQKWRLEAGLEDKPEVQALITDLKKEARRICTLDHSIRFRRPRLPDRNLPLNDLLSAVKQAAMYLRASEYGITTPRLYEDVGAYLTDDVVPRVLHDELTRELDALASQEPKDFHPGSGAKVQDIIHPSLYPYMANKTPVKPGVTIPPTEDSVFITEMHDKRVWDTESRTLRSSFSWIPTIFAISPNGADVSIRGYINGLGTRKQYPTLYLLIEQTFKIVLPLLERTVQHRFNEDAPPNPSRLRSQACVDYWRTNKFGANRGYRELLARHDADRAEENRLRIDQEAHRMAAQKQERAKYEVEHVMGSPRPSIWAGQDLKVIVKAANYHLEPGQEYSGTWHMEGMPHERIIASAIYYYGRDPSIVDAGLYLRRKRNDDEWPGRAHWTNRETFSSSWLVESSDKLEQPHWERIKMAPSDYGPDTNVGDLPAYNNIGVISTTSEEGALGTGRIVTFPNWVQHCIHSVYNHPSATEVATRKILCFFLVDDSDTSEKLNFPGFTYDVPLGSFVLTTSDIPPQDGACNEPTLGLLLRLACRQRTTTRRVLPLKIIEHIMQLGRQIEGWRMTREEAERRRRQLMADRKVQAQDVNGLWEVEYSLCEH